MSEGFITQLILAFSAGIFGSAHCLGMCGGLVSVCFMQLPNKGFIPYLLYHGSRILVYTLIGVLAALLGQTIIAAGNVGLTQAIIKTFAGLVIIILSLDIIGFSPFATRFGFAPLSWINSQIKFKNQQNYYVKVIVAGCVNALMPCPLTLAMAFQASTINNFSLGGLLMFSFGLGTLPSMLFASFIFNKIGAQARTWLIKISALMVMLLGVITLIAGAKYFLIQYHLLF